MPLCLGCAVYRFEDDDGSEMELSKTVFSSIQDILAGCSETSSRGRYDGAQNEHREII